MWFFKRTSPRRNQVRKKKAVEQFSQLSRFATTERLVLALLVLLFIVLLTFILSFMPIQRARYLDVIPRAVVVAIISLGAAFYIRYYQKRIVKNYTRAVGLAGLFLLLLAVTKIGVVLSKQLSWATGTAVTAALT